MYGVWIHEDNVARRPKSKKEIKEYLAKGVDHENNYHIGIEATSMFGNEESGPLTKERVEAGTILFVGPNPYEKRNFYGSFKINRKGEVVCE